MPLTSPIRRSMLFVPAIRPERFAKAMAAGADCVCIDLEDAVAPNDKAAAREHVAAYLGARPGEGPELAIRLNGISTRDGLRDLLFFAECAAKPDVIFLPKVRDRSELLIAGDILRPDGPPLVATIESPEGLLNAVEIALTPGLAGLMFGGGDFAAELGVPLAWEPLLHARSTLVIAAKRAGIDLIDVPFIDLKDADGLADETRRAKLLGFSGKAAIHPNQVAAINAAFTPTAAEVAHAETIVAAFAASSDGVLSIGGKMVEKPIIDGLNRTLAIARRAAAAR